MDNLLALLALFVMISLIFWKQIFNAYLYLFVPERILIIGEVTKMEEIPFCSAPLVTDTNLPHGFVGVAYEVIDFDDNFNPKTGIALPVADDFANYLYVVNESRKEVCVKVPREFYLETEKRFNQNDKLFSCPCHKYGYDSIFRLIEECKTQQISVVT